MRFWRGRSWLVTPAPIEENARLQALLINDIIDAARDASGTLRMDRRTIDIHSVAQAALAVVSPIAAAREIRLDYHPEGDPVCVNGDAVRLQQVIWNLLTNAIKFTSPGGGVALHVRDDGDVARIDVTDTGRGIDPEFLPLIFEAFAQDGEAEGARSAGAGLGLSIARRLVELHEGTIRAASDGPGRGATFTVRLPKALAAATTS